MRARPPRACVRAYAPPRHAHATPAGEQAVSIRGCRCHGPTQIDGVLAVRYEPSRPPEIGRGRLSAPPAAARLGRKYAYVLIIGAELAARAVPVQATAHGLSSPATPFLPGKASGACSCSLVKNQAMHSARRSIVLFFVFWGRQGLDVRSGSGRQREIRRFATCLLRVDRSLVVCNGVYALDG